MSERMTARVLGVVLGTASGWDQYGDNGVMFHEFEPADWTGDHLAGDTVCIDFEDGECSIFNGTGEKPERVLSSKELIALMAKAPC